MMRTTIGVVFAAAFTISGAAQDFMRRSDARPIAADMQPEPVRGGHEDAREAPIWVGPFGER
jgi:hypothetical protein